MLRLLPFVLLVACDPKPPPEDPAAPPCTDCALTDANNFTWSGVLTASEWRLTAGADATLTWADLDRDMYGDPLDPIADVTQVALLALPGRTPADVAEGIARDELLQADLGLVVFCVPAAATCRLSDFEIFDNDLEVERYFVEGTGTWVLALLTPADTIAAVAFLLPDAASTTTELSLGSDDTHLALDVDFRSLTPVTVTPGETFRVDWSRLTRDGLGNGLAVGTLDELVVARFDAPLATVEARAHDLVDSADALWSLDVAGTDATLDDLAGDVPFTGIDTDATWLLALYCSSCLNPAPRFATVLAAAETAP